MNLAQKLDRSRSSNLIDFSKYQSLNVNDPLFQIISSDRLVVEPCWTLENDWEGNRYRAYIAMHPEYTGVFVRSGLAERLSVAALALGDSYQLIIRAGHRPIEVQLTILNDCASDYKLQHPGESDAAALEYARTFVSDPSTSLPPHVAGAAVDVDVRNTSTGELLDFGSSVNDFTEESFLHYGNLTAEQQKNRLLLLTSMLGAGLASYRSEWWHYSYGDQVWAWFYGEETSLYSPIDVTA
jgi:D-alanyl-D-alanine dipeptidase